MRADVRLHEEKQLADGALVGHAWRGGHEQLPVDDLVAVAVVGERADHLDGPLCGVRGHGHTIDPLAPREQANMRRG